MPLDANSVVGYTLLVGLVLLVCTITGWLDYCVFGVFSWDKLFLDFFGFFFTPRKLFQWIVVGDQEKSRSLPLSFFFFFNCSVSLTCTR